MEDISEAIESLAHAIQHGLSRLGTGDAFTSMGALEAHAAAILTAAGDIAGAIRELSASIDDMKP